MAHECGELRRNLETPESREFWEFVDIVAEKVKKRPKWQGGEQEDEDA